MLRKYYTYFLVLLLLMYFNVSKGQVYAPDTTFKLNLTPEIGAKINFLHKINDSSFYVGTNIYDDYGKPFIRNLHIVSTSGGILQSYKDINSKPISANQGKVLLSNNNGTYLFNNQKLSFIHNQNAFGVNWEKSEFLINENGKVSIIDFEGNVKLKTIIPLKDIFFEKVVYFNADTLISLESNTLSLYDKTGNKLDTKRILPEPKPINYISYDYFSKLNDKLLSLEISDYSFPLYRNKLLIFDKKGNVILESEPNTLSQKILYVDNSEVIIYKRQRSNESFKYTFYDKSLLIDNNKTLFGENYRLMIKTDVDYIASDGTKIYKLSTKNSKYIEVLLPDTLTVNEKSIKILAKTVGSNEAVHISCDCGLIKNDTLFPKKAGNFIINFKTNSGLVLNKNLTIKKRTDSISFTGFRDLYLSELPLKFSINSKSGLPVKYSLEYNRQIILSNDEIINRGLPSSYDDFQHQYLLYLETIGNEEFESIRQKLVFKVKGIYENVNFENPKSNFILYPNPTTEGNFKVLYLGKEFMSNPVFKLFNHFGKEIEIIQVNNGNDYIYQLSPKTKIPTGIYFLDICHYSFESGKYENEVRKIVIQ